MATVRDVQIGTSIVAATVMWTHDTGTWSEGFAIAFTVVAVYLILTETR